MKVGASIAFPTLAFQPEFARKAGPIVLDEIPISHRSPASPKLENEDAYLFFFAFLSLALPVPVVPTRLIFEVCLSLSIVVRLISVGKAIILSWSSWLLTELSQDRLQIWLLIWLLIWQRRNIRGLSWISDVHCGQCCLNIVTGRRRWLLCGCLHLCWGPLLINTIGKLCENGFESTGLCLCLGGLLLLLGALLIVNDLEQGGDIRRCCLAGH